MSDRPSSHVLPERLALELEASSTAWLIDAKGGEPFAEVIETLGPDGVDKHLGAVHLSDISLTVGVDLDPTLLDWLRGTLGRQYPRKDGAVLVLDEEGHERRRLEFRHALVSEIRFPAFEAGSNEAVRLGVTLAPEWAERKPGSGSLASGPGQRRTKPSPASSFRLRIDGLECRSVSKVDELVVTTVLAQDVVGERREYEQQPGHLECSDVVVTLPEEAAASFHDWHDSFVVKGRNDPSAEKSGTLELLDPAMSTVVMALELRGLGIYRLTTETAPSGRSSAVASMYCQSIAFPAPPAPATLFPPPLASELVPLQAIPPGLASSFGPLRPTS